MIRPKSPDLAILRFLASRSHASAVEVGTACTMAPGEVRARLVMLESSRLVSGRQDKATGKPLRVYVVTDEGRRKAGISDARSTTQPFHPESPYRNPDVRS